MRDNNGDIKFWIPFCLSIAIQIAIFSFWGGRLDNRISNLESVVNPLNTKFHEFNERVSDRLTTIEVTLGIKKTLNELPKLNTKS